MIVLTHIAALLLGAVAGALVYRKNMERIERGRARAQSIADMFDRSKW